MPIGGPGAPHYGMICWSLVVTPTRLFAGCGETPNYDAAFRLDNGDSGDRTWIFGTSGNDQAIALTSDGQSLIFGGHFGTYGTMSVCSGHYLKNLGILHNIYGFSTPSLDCGFLPQFWGPDPFGGVWSIVATPTQIWAAGMFTMTDCNPGPAMPGQPPIGRVRRRQGPTRDRAVLLLVSLGSPPPEVQRPDDEAGRARPFLPASAAGGPAPPHDPHGDTREHEHRDDGDPQHRESFQCRPRRRADRVAEQDVALDEDRSAGDERRERHAGRDGRERRHQHGDRP